MLTQCHIVLDVVVSLIQVSQRIQDRQGVKDEMDVDDEKNPKPQHRDVQVELPPLGEKDLIYGTHVQNNIINDGSNSDDRTSCKQKVSTRFMHAIFNMMWTA